MIKGAERASVARRDRGEHDGPVPSPQVEPQPQRLSTPVPGRAFPVQTKLLVGNAIDPSEIEAERVAGSVVEALRRHADGSGDPMSGPRAHTAVLHRHAAHGGADSGVIGAEGGEVDRDMEATLHASAGSGSRLATPLRARLETVLGADLSAVRLHADATAGQLNRAMSATAFTHGPDIYFRDGLPDTGTDSGLRLLAHELTHTIQQGTSPLRRSALTGADQPAGEWTLAEPIHVETEDQGVHRHSAFEHYLLGQLQPKELAKIPAVRDVEKNKEQRKNVAKGHGSGLADKDLTKKEEKKLRSEVKHLIDQEMDRLLDYRKDPEALSDRLGEKGKVTKTDGVWEVPIVVLACRDGEIVVSYSEMNTMPDLFGNPEAIKATPKAKVLAILQGVRQQLYIELSNLRKELFGFADNELHNTVKWDDDFAEATGPRSQAVIDKVYEIRTEKQVNSATTREGEEYEQYFAALERNACHFAPESWNQWRGYHDRAMELAQEAARLRARANDVREKFAGMDSAAAAADRFDQQADEKANEALIQNSFGEHYLQDSFAAGHLIDKTKIMQWFTIWLENNKKSLGSTNSGQAGFAMALHAAKSDLTSNPQALHDKGVRGELATGEDAAAEIGMGVDNTPEITFMMRWRALAKAKPKKRTLTISDAALQFKIGRRVAETMFELLVGKGFVTVDDGTGRGKKMLAAVGAASRNTDKNKFQYTLDEEMVDVLTPGRKERRGFLGQVGKKVAYPATKGRPADKTGAISDQDAQAAAAEFNLASYNLMMSNAYIGGATKYFHDRFCKEGLEVMSDEGVELGRIYGDQNMLNAGGQVGVEYSAETSKRSREAVFDTLAGKQAKHSTSDIEKRFPTQVKVDDAYIDIVKFNDELRKLGDNGLFKKAAGFGAHVVYKASDGISAKGALDVASLASGGHGAF
jgi:hypothetical protein